jgi:pyruvate,water dikinase
MGRKKVLLKGKGASAGKAAGKVKIILKSSQFDKMRKGDILVTEMTNPFFVPLMSKASGIITDVGGLICHAAIVSREMGIPCIVGAEKATKTLKDKMKIRMDGKTGEIYAIKK